VWQECVITDAQGNSNDCDIGAQFFDGQGNEVGGNVKVNDVGVGQAETYSVLPSVAMNAAGNSVVAWADSRTGSQGDVFGQRFAANGQMIGGNFQVSTGQGILTNRPEVEMLDNGRFLVVWEDTTTAGRYQTRGRFYAADGSPETGPFLLSPNPSVQTGYPSVASNGTSFLAAWASEQQGDVLAINTSTLDHVVPTTPAEGPTVSALAIYGYPNPFTKKATVRYDVPEAGPVQVAVYDLLGREMVQLVNSVQPAGTHEVSLQASGWSLGVYVLRVRQAAQVQTRLLVHHK
jgi:hypothetical protein